MAESRASRPGTEEYEAAQKLKAQKEKELAEFTAKEQAAIRAAGERYPEMLVDRSQFRTRLLAKMGETQAKNDPIMNDPNRIYLLANEVATQLLDERKIAVAAAPLHVAPAPIPDQRSQREMAAEAAVARATELAYQNKQAARREELRYQQQEEAIRRAEERADYLERLAIAREWAEEAAAERQWQMQSQIKQLRQQKQVAEQYSQQQQLLQEMRNRSRSW